ncbi:MAG: hypothetical protein JWR05_3024 [Mucilaginibacter sp.]|nr:hypothetical protein [Mucilaginibacter sp.]
MYEEIILISDELIKVGLVVWSKRKGYKPGQHILILVNGKNVIFTEHQNEDWVKVFGNSFDLYYNYFKAELLSGRYLSDQLLCEKLIDEIDGNAG